MASALATPHTATRPSSLSSSFGLSSSLSFVIMLLFWLFWLFWLVLLGFAFRLLCQARLAQGLREPFLLPVLLFAPAPRKPEGALWPFLPRLLRLLLLALLCPEVLTTIAKTMS